MTADGLYLPNKWSGWETMRRHRWKYLLMPGGRQALPKFPISATKHFRRCGWLAAPKATRVDMYVACGDFFAPTGTTGSLVVARRSALASLR